MSAPNHYVWLCRAWAVVIGAFPVLLALAFLPWLDGPFSVPKTAVLTLGATVLFAASLVARDGPALRQPPVIAAIIFLGVVLLSAAFSPYRRMTAEGVTWAASAVLIIAAAPILALHIRTLLAGIALAGSAVAAVAVLQFFFALDLFRAFGFNSENPGRMRMYATLGNPDFVAAFLAVCVPALLVLAAGGGARRWFGTAGAVLSIAAVVAAGSRVGLCATVVAVGTTIFALYTARTHRPLAIALALACLLAVFLPGLNRRSIGESLLGRTFVWRVSLSGVVQHPFLGDGPNTFRYLYPSRLGAFLRDPQRADLLRFAGNERHAENDYLEILSETGLLGLSALLFLLAVWVRSSLRSREAAPMAVSAALGGVAAVSMAALADFPLHRPETWGVFCLWIAIALASSGTKPGFPCGGWRRFARVAVAIGVVMVAMLMAARSLAASYWSSRGARAESTAEPYAATLAYEHALRWDPAWANARFNLVRALAKSGRFEESWRASDAALEFVNEPESWLLRARIQRVRGNPALALWEVRSGLRLFPHSQELQAELAELARMPRTP